VVIGEDAAVGVDDEAAAGAAPRRVALAGIPEIERAVIRRIGGARAADPRPAAAPSRRRVDVDDRGVQALDDVGEAHQRGHRRRSRRHARGPGDRRLGRRSGRDRRPGNAAGDNRPDEERDDGGQRDGDEGEAPRHRVRQL